MSKEEYYRAKAEASRMAKRPRATKSKPSRADVEIHTWFERDRQHIEIRNKKTDKTVAEWWDDAVDQMFQDGFFYDYRGLGMRAGSEQRKFEESVLKYAEDMGILAKG